MTSPAIQAMAARGANARSAQVAGRSVVGSSFADALLRVLGQGSRKYWMILRLPVLTSTVTCMPGISLASQFSVRIVRFGMLARKA